MNYKKFYNRHKHDIQTIGASGTVYGREIGEYHFMYHGVGIITDDIDLHTIIEDLKDQFIGHFKSFEMKEMILHLKDGRIVKWSRDTHSETTVTGMSFLKAMGCCVRD